MKFQVSIGYRDLFEDYDTVDVIELIRDIPTSNALEIISYFLAQLHTLEQDHTLQLHFLQMWVDRLPVKIHQRINNFIGDLLNKPYAEYNFLNNVSGMKLEELLIENLNTLTRLSDLTPLQELNLFKAYLYCSQQWIDEQLPGFKVPQVQKDEDVVELLLPTQLPFQEVLEFKDFRLQFIKAIYFFKFCEGNEQFKIYLKIFLDEYNLDSWQKYLVNLISLYLRKFERLKTPSVVNVPDEFIDIKNFLNDLSINPDGFFKAIDFLALREKPVFREGDDNFIFLNLNFLVDKVYQGIQFDFAKALVRNSATYKNKLIKSPLQFLSIFGDEFSETGLFYSVMNYAFEKSGYLKCMGTQMKEKVKASEPDYYMRDKSKVYVFEFKNIFLGSGIKYSYDFNQIKDEVFKKLVLNQSGSSKGVTQLVNTIESMRSGAFAKIDAYNFDEAIIYPIIVYVDFSFNLAGFNYILNKEFIRQVKDKGLYDLNIQPLTLIDIDTFIKFQDLIRNKSLKINNCLNEYNGLKVNSKDVFLRLSTFNMFMHNKTRKMKYDSPKMLMEEVMHLLPETE